MHDRAKRRRERYHTDSEFRQRSIETANRWYENHKDDPEDKERRKAYQIKHGKHLAEVQKELNKQRPFHYAFMRLRLRAKQNDIQFNLDEEYLKSIWTGKCAILGTTLSIPYSTSWNDPTKATIDKVIPKLGYVKGNVDWVSNRANTIKRDGTLEELESIISYMKAHIERASKHLQDPLIQ